MWEQVPKVAVVMAPALAARASPKSPTRARKQRGSSLASAASNSTLFPAGPGGNEYGEVQQIQQNAVCVFLASARCCPRARGGIATRKDEPRGLARWPGEHLERREQSTLQPSPRGVSQHAQHRTRRQHPNPSAPTAAPQLQEPQRQPAYPSGRSAGRPGSGGKPCQRPPRAAYAAGRPCQAARSGCA